jgi:hypothetical protein
MMERILVHLWLVDTSILLLGLLVGWVIGYHTKHEPTDFKPPQEPLL